MGTTPPETMLVIHSIINWKPLLVTPLWLVSCMLMVWDTDTHISTHMHMGEARVSHDICMGSPIYVGQLIRVQAAHMCMGYPYGTAIRICDRIWKTYHLHTYEIIIISDFAPLSHMPTKSISVMILVIEAYIQHYLPKVNVVIQP